MNLASIAGFARTHHGLVTYHHALDQGWSHSGWYRAIHRGDLIRAAPLVARVAAVPSTREAAILAPLLSLGPSAIASHRSAAWLWGLDGHDRDPIDVTLIRTNTTLDAPGVVVHRPRDLVDLSPSRRRGIPVTNPLRVLVDLGAVAPERVGPALETFVIAGLLSPSAASATLQRHARQGRSGVAALREAIDAWRFGTKRPDSILETAMAGLATRHGLPAMEFHARRAGIEVDFLVVGSNLVVECDGWRWHGSARATFERDRERDALLGAAGYVVRRFTWSQIVKRSAWVAEMVRQSMRWARREDELIAPTSGAA